MKLEEAQAIFKQASEAYKNDNINHAIELFSKIEKNFDGLNKIYARAQFHLANLMDDLKRYEEAEKAYNNVQKEDNVGLYTNAQFNLGVSLKQQDRLKEAEEAYNNVQKEYSIELYTRAQCNLGFLLRKQN